MRTFTYFLILVLAMITTPALASDYKSVVASGRSHTKVIQDETQVLLTELRASCPGAGEDKLVKSILQHSSFPGGQAGLLVASCCAPDGAHACGLSAHLIIYDSTTGRLDRVSQDEFGDAFTDATMVRNSQGTYDVLVYDLMHQGLDSSCCPTLCQNRHVSWDNTRHVLVVARGYNTTSSGRSPTSGAACP